MTGAARGWVDARYTAVHHVFRPLRPRPISLLMSARGVDQPTRSDPGEGGLGGPFVGGIRCSTWKSGVGKRARGRGTPVRTPAAALRGERPHREQAEENYQGNPGTVTVKRAPSLMGPRRVAPIRLPAIFADQLVLKWRGAIHDGSANFSGLWRATHPARRRTLRATAPDLLFWHPSRHPASQQPRPWTTQLRAAARHVERCWSGAGRKPLVRRRCSETVLGQFKKEVRATSS